MQSQETCWFISNHAEGSDLPLLSAWATAEAAHLCPVLTTPVENTSVQQWAPCQLAFNSSSHFLDRLDTKPVLQKTQHPSHCITGWASVTVVPGCYFLDVQGSAKWAHPPRPFDFQHPLFQKTGSWQIKINASRAQSLPATSGPNPVKYSYFLWKVECSCALLSFFWQLGQPQQPAELLSLQRKTGHPLLIYWGLVTFVQNFFKQMYKFSFPAPLIHTS